MSFFALSIAPNNITSEGSCGDVNKTCDRVFNNRDDALKALKTNKNSRLKSFTTIEEAERFASDPNEALKPLDANGKTDETDTAAASQPTSGEGCPYKGLTPQELKQLKQSIIDEDVDTFDKLVEKNPRYLMTPCDTPSVLHSGTRSNALHVAALAGSAKMTNRIIYAIQDPELMIKMYPGESAESRTKRQEYLFDYYLNMPKKGDFDTPLHQAAKYGHLEVVKLLSEFSSCDTKFQNKEGFTPAEVACSRMKSPVDEDVKRRIIDILSDHVYIPVYRTFDLSSPAYVGDPWDQ